MLLVDSREKWTQDGSKDAHIKDYFDRHAVAYAVQKLDVGDYMLDGNPLSVDRKQNLDELARNLLNKSDHARFWREVRRARETGIHLVVLCEHGGKVKSIKDVASWRSKYSGISGRSLMEEIYRVHIAYGVDFLFCSKRSTGKLILEILKGE